MLCSDWSSDVCSSDLFTTTIYDVYDRYVEMYGLDAVIPVERTDIGNISLSSVLFEPELFRCMTLKGAEIILRTATGGCEWHDMRLTAPTHDVLHRHIVREGTTVS